MIVKTAKGVELECDSITSIPSPARLYLHIVNMDMATANSIFSGSEQLPIEGYPSYTEVKSIISEGSARVRVSLKGD